MDLVLSFVITLCLAYITWKLVKAFNTYRGWCKMFTYKSVTPIGPTHSLLGHLHLFKNQSELDKLLTEVSNKTKTKLIGIWTGFFYPMITAVHPDTVQILLKSTEAKPRNVTSGYNGLLPWIGEGLIISQGRKWERNRRLLTPAFHFDILWPYFKIYNKVADILVEKFKLQSTSSAESINVYEPARLAAFDTMLQCAFSYDSNVQQTGASNPYVQAVKTMGILINARTMKPWQFWYPMFKLTPSGRLFTKMSNYVHNFDEEIIRKRKEALKNDKSLLEKRHLDFLDILLTAKDENGVGLTPREIRDEVDTFMFAGHDTVGSAITWGIYNLAKHPEEQQKVYQEVIEVMGERSEVKYDDISKFKRLGMFVRESMRYSSPVPMISRVTTKETVLDGAVIPAGVQVMASLHTIHNRKDVWENPDKFDPERFEDSKMKTRDPYMHVPFSAGSRNCIGQHFALDEIKVTLIKVVRTFKLKVNPDNIPIMVPEMVMRCHDNGVHVFFEERLPLNIETDV